MRMSTQDKHQEQEIRIQELRDLIPKAIEQRNFELAKECAITALILRVELAIARFTSRGW